MRTRFMLPSEMLITCGRQEVQLTQALDNRARAFVGSCCAFWYGYWVDKSNPFQVTAAAYSKGQHQYGVPERHATSRGTEHHWRICLSSRPAVFIWSPDHGRS